MGGEVGGWGWGGVWCGGDVCNSNPIRLTLILDFLLTAFTIYYEFHQVPFNVPIPLGCILDLNAH